MRDQISWSNPSWGPFSPRDTFLTCVREGTVGSQGHRRGGTLGSGPVGPRPLAVSEAAESCSSWGTLGFVDSGTHVRLGNVLWRLQRLRQELLWGCLCQDRTEGCPGRQK